MKTAKIVKVYEIGKHAYDNSQRETVFRVLLSNGRRCWMVGYGSDYVPASKKDLQNIYNVKSIAKKDDLSAEYETAMGIVGMTVHSSRNCK